MRIVKLNDAINKFKKLEIGKTSYLFEYLERVKDQDFIECPFSIVDALILSILPYFRFDFMSEKENSILKLYEASQLYFLHPDLVETQKANKNKNSFLKQLAQSNRFGNLKLFKYERIFSEALEVQFAAISIEINPETVFIAFSGTDGTLTGIKEDMNMAYLNKIPSQIQAKKYIKDKIYKKYKNIYLGGHSKGGNLAIYSLMKAEPKFKNKVKNVFNFDGPGFTNKILKENDALDITNKIITIVPDMSVFGMIWNRLNNIIVISSSNFSVLQHDPFSWMIDEHNHFLYKNYVKNSSGAINESVDKYFEEMSDEERKQFVDLLWYFMKNTFNESIKEYKTETFKKGIESLKLYKELNDNSKEILKKHINILTKAMIASKKSTKNFESDIDLAKLLKLDNIEI